MHYNGVCAGFSSMQHTHWRDTTILSNPPEHLACVEVFLVTHSALCFQRDVSGRQHVKDSVRWSLTFRPELCRRDVFVPSAGGGSRADLIVCTSKCTLQHQCAAPFHIMRRRLISALIANWLISLAQISESETFIFFYPLKSGGEAEESVRNENGPLLRKRKDLIFLSLERNWHALLLFASPPPPARPSQRAVCYSSAVLLWKSTLQWKKKIHIAPW